MAGIAQRPKIIKIQTKVRAVSDWNLVIGMEVLFAATEAVSQLSKYLIGRRITQLELQEVNYDVRRPATIDATPAIPSKTENPQLSMVGVVPPTGRCWPLAVAFVLVRSTLLFSVVHQFTTSNVRALVLR